MPDVVLFEKEGPIGLVTINRPEQRNPLNMAVFRALDGILDTIIADEEVRAVVVTGAGAAFVVGADIAELLGYDTKTD